MSADSYSHCPRCQPDGESTDPRQDAIGRAREAYGKVSLERYEELLRAASAQPESVEPYLREDYEFYWKDGSLNIFYNGYCSNCGFLMEHCSSHLPEHLDLSEEQVA